MKPQLSDTIKELIAKARIMNFAGWAEEMVPIFQSADDQRRYLTDEDLARIQALSTDPHDLLSIVKQLRDQAPAIVDEARSQLFVHFPTITDPGGDLYPPERAEACWRDFWHFLRCISYGIAGQSCDYTSDQGLHFMQLLYQELRVPLAAMVVGLEGIQSASLNRLDPGLHARLIPYFSHLTEKLRAFRDS